MLLSSAISIRFSRFSNNFYYRVTFAVAGGSRQVPAVVVYANLRVIPCFYFYGGIVEYVYHYEGITGSKNL